MKPKVFILATCRNTELLPATLLVFNSLRMGFPTADVVVFDNGNSPEHRRAIAEKCDSTGCSLIEIPRTTHVKWIEALFQAETVPFYLLDTDVAFWSKVEHWQFDTAIAGRRMPQFFDLYTRCVTMTRLHTCLMYVNPAKVKAEVARCKESFVSDFGDNSLINLFKSFFCITPDGQRTYYDTAAMLSYHVSATDFNDEHNAAFDHLNCGSYADVVDPVYRGLLDSHRKVYCDPHLLRGAWTRQKNFFESLRQ